MPKTDWRNTLRNLLIAVAAVMGLVIAGRLFLGPFRFLGIPVNTPLNPEGIFGLSIVLSLAAARRESVSMIDQCLQPFAYAAAGVLSIAALARGLGVSFVSDDFVILRLAGDFTPGYLISIFTTPGGDGFFRPIGLLSFAGDGAWAGQSAAAWHVTGLALHAASSMLVVSLALRMRLSSPAAFVAGALFAVHGGRPEAVAWIAARFDLLATFFTLLAFLFFERGRNAAALAAFALAVWSKEAAYMFPFLLVVISLYWGRPVRRTAPFFAVAALLFGHRLLLFGGIGGYNLEGRPQVFMVSWSTLKAIVVRLWTGLFFPLDWSTEPSVLLGALCALAMAGTLWLAARTRCGRPLWLLIAALLIAIVPPLHLLSAGPDLAGARLVYLPSIFFCLLLGTAFDGLASAKAPVAASILLFHIAAVQHNLDSWLYASERVRAACRTAAAYDAVHVIGLPLRIRGAQAFNKGFPECVDLAAGRNVDVRMNDGSTAGAVRLVWNPATLALEPGEP